MRNKYKGTVPLIALGAIFITIIIIVIAMAATKNKEISMVDLPKEINAIKAETKAHLPLQQLIIDYYEIPTEDYKTTKYFYNYIDLNNDGTNEIFVFVMGSYASGTAKNKALWVFENENKLSVRQDFSLVTPPIIISDTITRGVRELIFPYYSEGTKPQYSVLSCYDGHFPLISNGKIINTLDGITGDAIIANDIVAETAAGIDALNLVSK